MVDRALVWISLNVLMKLIRGTADNRDKSRIFLSFSILRDVSKNWIIIHNMLPPHQSHLKLTFLDNVKRGIDNSCCQLVYFCYFQVCLKLKTFVAPLASLATQSSCRAKPQKFHSQISSTFAVVLTLSLFRHLCMRVQCLAGLAGEPCLFPAAQPLWKCFSLLQSALRDLGVQSGR